MDTFFQALAAAESQKNYQKNSDATLQDAHSRMNKAALQEQMRSFDTHAPLKMANEVSPVAHRIQLLMHMALELDPRGLEAVIHCATFHRRYPKGA